MWRASAGAGTGVGSLLAGLMQTRQGWGQASVPVLLAASALLLGAFVLVERGIDAPMLDLTLCGNPGFTAATIGALVTGATAVGEPLDMLHTKRDECRHMSLGCARTVSGLSLLVDADPAPQAPVRNEQESLCACLNPGV